VIRRCRNKKTQQFFAGEMVREFSSFKKVSERKLTMLDNESDLKDLLSPPGNRLEMLRGDRIGSDRAAQHQDQRSVEDLFSLEGRRTV
jgi:proteic killer suppression protein